MHHRTLKRLCAALPLLLLAIPDGSPFGPGIKAAVAYLHGCQLVGLKRLTELCEGLTL